MQDQNLGSFGRARSREAARQPDAVALYEIHGPDHRGRAVDLAQVFDVQISRQVGARHRVGEAWIAYSRLMASASARLLPSGPCDVAVSPETD